MIHLHGGFIKELTDIEVAQSLKTSWHQSEENHRDKGCFANAISSIHQDRETISRIPANAQGYH